MTYTSISSSLQVNLICTDTETANSHQVFGFIQDSLCKFCLGANTDDMNIPDLLNQLFTHQSFSVRLNLNGLGVSQNYK